MTGELAQAGREPTDAELVGRCRAGDCQAFGLIVRRYQSLVCALAYAACGDFARSEDVAQEVFLRAWKQIAALRDPERVREWLCGIARRAGVDAYRRRRREPAEGGGELPADATSPEPRPSEAAARREEEQILWRALERIAPGYREPLVLYYREHRSIEHVACALDLSEENVRQRLSRGRKALQEEVERMLEGTLAASRPGEAFTAAVVASLPPLAALGPVGAGASAAKGGALKTILFAGWAAGLLVAVWGMIAHLRAAPTRGARRRGFIKWTILWAGCLVFTASFFLMVGRPGSYWFAHPAFRWLLLLGGAMLYAGAVGLYGWSCAAGDATIPRGEYVSRRRLLGLPLVHIRFGAGPAKPAIGWIAIGDSACGAIFACGHLAAAPLAFGVLSLGPIALGGLAAGGFAFGFVAVGAAVIGGLAAGLWAYGGSVFGWVAAVGGAAGSRSFALAAAGFTFAPHANDAPAYEAIGRMFLFRHQAILLALGLVISWAPLFATLAWRRAASRRSPSS